MNNLSEMGVSGQMLKFIHNYLNERTIKVNIGNTLSRFLGMTLGRKLDWRAHIATLKGETLRALNVLRVISCINFGPD